ncbi:unnamed protein product [Withania somnifera]
MVFGKSFKPKKPKSREVSSRYLSPTSKFSILDYENQSPQNIVPKPSSSTGYKYKSLEKLGLMGKLWPSFSSDSSSISMMNTLANHLENDRLKDLEKRKHRENPKPRLLSLTKQKSFTTISRFENEKEKIKDKGTSIFGSASMRYTGKIKIPGRLSTHSSESSNSKDDYSDQIAPGRFSVDANSLGRRCNSARMIRSDILSDIANDSESEYSDISFDSPVLGRNIAPSYMAPTVSSRKAGMAVPSKYMQDSLSKSRRFSAESSVQNPDSPKIRLKFKNPMQRATPSLNTKISMALSPRTPSSPPVFMENKGIFTSNRKPPTSPSKGKKVGNFISMGLELLKGKKVSSGAASPLRPGMTDPESVHQLKMLNNSWLQLRYINARADSVHHNISKQAEENLVYALDGLVKLRQSVLEKMLQLQRQKLELKLSCVLHSQIKLLEDWGSMEREHSSAVSKSIEGLQSAVCRVPLIEGATVEPQSAIIALQHASDVSSKIKLEISKFSSGAERTADILKEMAQVVVQEKLMLEECSELFKNISILQSLERNLRCSIIQLRQQQERHCKREKEIVSA